MSANPSPLPAGDEPRMIGRKDGGIGWLIYSNRRHRNAITFNMWRQIPEIVERFASDPEIRVVALRGDGEESFVSGADISEFEALRSSPESLRVYDEASGRAARVLQSLAKPTVAVIRGWCVGGGIATAVNCDLRLAADDTRFFLPAARLGVGYGYDGVKTLVSIVGPAVAKEIFFTARRYDAQEALAKGLVTRLFPAAEFEARARDYLAEIAANAPLTISAAKMAIDAVVAEPAGRDLSDVNQAIATCFASEDYREGKRAFMEKRRPTFCGR